MLISFLGDNTRRFFNIWCSRMKMDFFQGSIHHIAPLVIVGAASLVLFAPISSMSATEGKTTQAAKKPDVVSAAITDYGAVMNGKRERKELSIRPLLEDWTGFVVIKNTGTVPIDHFRISFSCPMEDSTVVDVDLVSPPLPSWLWKPFAGDMLSLCTRDMDCTVKTHALEMCDVSTGDPIAVTGLYPAQRLGPQGLAPGDAILIEYTEPYIDCIKGFINSIAERKHMDVETEVVDRQKNLMHMVAKNYKLMFFTLDRIVVAITFKGIGEKGACDLQLSIDDRLCDSVPWPQFEWK